MTEKRSVSLAGHRTSVALEPEFWAAVERLAAARGQSLAAFIASVDRERKNRNLASALRVTVLMSLDRASGNGFANLPGHPPDAGQADTISSAR